MRAAQEARENAALVERGEEMARKQRELERRRATLDAQIAGLRAEFKAAEEEAALLAKENQVRERVLNENRGASAKWRGADNNEDVPSRKRK
jgi:circadian clock protein KaiC